MKVPAAKSRALVDFWAGYNDRDELWMISLSDQDEQQEQSSALDDWARENGFRVRQIRPPDERASKIYLENWGAIVRELSSNRRYVKPKLIEALREILTIPRPISAACNLLPEEDPVLVRVAIFHLLHAGLLVYPDIATRLIGPSSIVGPA